MAEVALVSYDVQTIAGRNGGVGAATTHLARLLRQAGESVTIVFANGSPQPLSIDTDWRGRYAAWGIGILEVHNTPLPDGAWHESWPARLSEQLEPHLRRFDIVYLQDWANAGFHSIRRQRHSLAPGPIWVTVLHGPSEWARSGNRKLPDIPDDSQLAYLERYSAEHSDHVIAPSRYMSDWLKDYGWRFRSDPEVLGLPYFPPALPAPTATVPVIERLILFGRLEVRKGFHLFRDALRLLCAEHPGTISRIREIVLLGSEQEPGSVAGLRGDLSALGLSVTHIADLDSLAANTYLAARSASALVVIPSPFENFPYSVVETLSIPGLNVICSRGGGIPEVFGGECDAQLFDPKAPALAAKIVARVHQPLPAAELATYDRAGANARWLDFHRRACAGRAPRTRTALRPAVDVCFTYYNKGPYLPHLLQALTAQTEPAFGVIAVDDGSTSAPCREAFDEARNTYAARGWRFLRQQNAFVDAARNRAAEASTADFLLFIDADDVPATNTIERLLDGALASGVDCLTTGGYYFDSLEMPYDVETGALRVPGAIGYLPLGPDLTGGLVDPMVFGLPMILIRRSVFQQIGGYRECRGAGHEDWELQVRLLQAGFQTDVLPERLLFFRRLADGLTHSGASFPSKQRLMESYSRPLVDAGMPGLAAAVFQLNQRCLELRQQLKDNIPLQLRLQLHAQRQSGKPPGEAPKGALR